MIIFMKLYYDKNTILYTSAYAKQEFKYGWLTLPTMFENFT